MADIPYSTAQIRSFLNQTFDDVGLDAFCQDYYPAVFDRFSRGMRKDEKITLLLDHCRRTSGGFESLRQVVQSEYETSNFQRDELRILAEAISLLTDRGYVSASNNSTGSSSQFVSTRTDLESTSKEEKMKDFFVSYNGKDKNWAEWVAWQLEDAGYTTVIQAWDFRPGGNFVLDMQRAAAEAQRTIAVLSPNYLNALYTQPEWAAAFAQDPTGAKKSLLPVRVQECELKGLLSQIVYIDLVGKSEAEARGALLSGLKVGRAKPMVAPSFPGNAAATHTQSEKPPFPEDTTPISSYYHPTPMTPSTSLPRFKQIKLKSLEERLETLVEQYNAANQQLNTTLAAADKVTIQQQIKNLEREIQAVEQDIDQLKA